MSDLSYYYFRGMGVEQNITESVKWMERANEKSEGLFDDRLDALKQLAAKNN